MKREEQQLKRNKTKQNMDCRQKDHQISAGSDLHTLVSAGEGSDRKPVSST